MSKLSVVRQIKQQKNCIHQMDKEMEKELKWDSRFHLGKLPDYDVMNDKNYLSMKMLRDQIKTMEITTNKKMHPIREKIEIFSNLNIPYPYINTKASEENKYNEEFNEELNLVQSMWDDLGVTDDYRQIFENVAKELDENTRRGFFEFEINSLKRFSDNLFKLSKDINARDKTIAQLRLIDETLLISKEKLNEKEKLLNEVIQLIRNIRIQSINIVYHFNKIREISSYNFLAGKFNMDKMNKIYVYDKNYLIKMRYDLDFLKASNLAEFFEFSEDTDPFLKSTSDNSKNENKKLHVPISPEMLQSIKECEYQMLNDIIYFQMQTKKVNKLQNYPRINKSSKHFKLKYPLAHPFNHNKFKFNPIHTFHKHRPSSSSNDFYIISQKSPEKNQKMFLTKMNENFLKSYHHKRMVIDNKIKSDKEDYKSQDNFYNTKYDLNKVRAKSSRKERKEIKFNKNEYDCLYNYNGVNLKPDSKDDFYSQNSEKIETDSYKYNTVKSKESVQIIKDNHETLKNSQENLPYIVENENIDKIEVKTENNMNQGDTIRGSIRSKKSVKINSSYHDSKDSNYKTSKITNENEIADEKIHDEVDVKINKDNSNKKNSSIVIDVKLEKDESQDLVEEIISDQQKKENSCENLKKTFDEKSQPHITNEIKDNKDNFISRISNKISEDNRDNEDEINYDLRIEEEEIIRDNVHEVNKNILDDLKLEETEKIIHEEQKNIENEVLVINLQGEELNKKSISVIHNKSVENIKEIEKIQTNVKLVDDKNTSLNLNDMNHVQNKFQIEEKQTNILLNNIENVHKQHEDMNIQPIDGLENMINNNLINQSESVGNEIVIENLKIKNSIEFNNEEELSKNKINDIDIKNVSINERDNLNIDQNILNKDKDEVMNLQEDLNVEKHIDIANHVDEVDINYKEENKTDLVETKQSHENRINETKNEEINILANNSIHKTDELLEKKLDHISTNVIGIQGIDVHENKQYEILEESRKIKVENVSQEINLYKDIQEYNTYSHHIGQENINEKMIEYVQDENLQDHMINPEKTQEDNKLSDKNMHEPVQNISTSGIKNDGLPIQQEIEEKLKSNLESNINEQIPAENIDNNVSSPVQETNQVSPISISFFTGDIENFQSIYPIYLMKVKDELKVSFKIENDIQSYLTGIYPKVLLAYKNSMMVGICCVSYDSANDHNLRLNINHISTNSFDDFELIASEFKKFIASNIPCDEMTIGIYYEFKDGNLDINAYIRDIFKNSLKFKWLKLENKSNNERIQILNFKCERENVLLEEQKNKMKIFLKLDYFSVLKVEELKEKRELAHIEYDKKNEQKVNFLSLMFCLLELTRENYQLENEIFKKISIEHIEKWSKNIMNCSGNREEIWEFIKKNLSDNHLTSLNPKLDSNLASSTIMLNLKFPSHLTSTVHINDERYLYNRIYNPSIELLLEKESNQEFYLVPTYDGINSLIVCELNQDLQSTLNSSKLNLSQFFSELYFKLDNTSRPDKKISTIWLPCFNIIEGLSLPYPNCASDIVIKKDGLDYFVSHVDEFVQIAFNKDNNYISSPSINPKEEDIVIKRNFMIAVINYELLNEMNIPSIFVYVVDSANWNKI